MSMDVDAKHVLNRWLDGAELDEAEARALLHELAAGRVDAALAGGLLVALRAKGESPAEIRGFARAMRELSLKPALPASAAGYVDIVGTGGDASGSLNLSTGSALLTAASGVEVVKHGNRSVSSQSGSADVLAELGLTVPLAEDAAARCLAATRFTFLFAPHYHPAMKHIAPVRGALGIRTVFNILGPLVNPAEPPYHVIGAYSEAMAELMAETLAGLPLERAFVVHGAPGWDEATPVGPFLCLDVRGGRVERQTRDPADFGIARADAGALIGGDAAHNAARIEAALAGRDTAAHRDALVLGAALALEVTGTCADFAAALGRAREGLESGAGAQLLASLRAFDAEAAP